MATLLAILLA